MRDLLTNPEIDALLELFRAEGVPVEESGGSIAGPGRRAGEGPVVSEVDLLKPNRFGREHIRGLERLFETCAKGLAATISDRLRLDMLCDCVVVEQTRFSSWLRQITSPCAIFVVKMAPLEVPVLLTLTTSLLYGAVDRILGGSGKIREVRNDFTTAEWVVADAFVQPCLERIRDSFKEIVKLDCKVEGRFCNPSMAQILPGQDVVLGVHFQISSEFLLGDLRLVFPYAALEPHLDKVELGPGAAFRASPGALREVTARSVRAVPLTMSVVLGETRVPLRQLLELAVGDVLPLRTRVGQPLAAPVQGKTKFLGQVGTRGTQLAFQVGAVVSKA